MVLLIEFSWFNPATRQALVIVTFDMGGGKAVFAATIYAQEVSELTKSIYSQPILVS